MTEFTCCVKIEFDAAHRVLGHKGKCQNVHGHRYIVEVVAQSSQLNALGMVVDFGFLKSVVKKWIDENFDHNIILCSQDSELGSAISSITKQNVYYLPYNPTAENIAFYLKNNVLSTIVASEDFAICEVKVHETNNCWAKV